MRTPAAYTRLARFIFAMGCLAAISMLAFFSFYVIDFAVNDRTITQPGDPSSWKSLFYPSLLFWFLGTGFTFIETGIGIVIANSSDQAKVTTVDRNDPSKTRTTGVPQSGVSAIRVTGFVLGLLAMLFFIFVAAVFGYMYDHCWLFNLCCAPPADPETCSCDSPRSMFLAYFSFSIIGAIFSTVLLIAYVAAWLNIFRRTTTTPMAGLSVTP